MVRVQYRQLKTNSFVQSLDMPIERYLTSLRIEQRGKLDQIGLGQGVFGSKTGYIWFVSNTQKLAI